MESIKKSVFIDEPEEKQNVVEFGVSTDSIKKEFEEELSEGVSVVSGKNLKIELRNGRVVLLDNIIEFVFGRNYFYYIRIKEGTTSIPSDTIKNVFLLSPASSKWRKVLVPKFTKGM